MPLTAGTVNRGSAAALGPALMVILPTCLSCSMPAISPDFSIPLGVQDIIGAGVVANDWAAFCGSDLGKNLEEIQTLLAPPLQLGASDNLRHGHNRD